MTTDLVHWRQQFCGVQDRHEPHAYWTIDGTRVCEGVTEAQALGFALERLAFAIRTMLTPTLYRLNEQLLQLHRALKKGDDA